MPRICPSTSSSLSRREAPATAGMAESSFPSSMIPVWRSMAIAMGRRRERAAATGSSGNGFGKGKKSRDFGGRGLSSLLWPLVFPPSSPMAVAAALAIRSSPYLLRLRCSLNSLPPPPSSLRFSPPATLPSAICLVALPHPPPPRAKRANPRTLALAEQQQEEALAVTQEEEEEEEDVENGDGDGGIDGELKVVSRARPCELYVCNLPRSCDAAHLVDLFKPYGTINSVTVSRDAVTGISRGCGYVTMSSIAEARAAIAALDGSDVGEREMRVKFSADMVSGRHNTNALNTAPKKDIVFESPHKVYVGNLAWSVRPEDLREHFSQIGTVVSTRVLYDRKGRKNRVYGFLSFSSDEELQAALELNESVFHGRTLLVREVINREEA